MGWQSSAGRIAGYGFEYEKLLSSATAIDSPVLLGTALDTSKRLRLLRVVAEILHDSRDAYRQAAVQGSRARPDLSDFGGGVFCLTGLT